MKLDDFDYELPEALVAQEPAAERADARLLVHDVEADATRHRAVRDLPGLLAPGDLLVLNDTRVRPARVHARRPGGGRVELLFVEREAGPRPVWRALARPAARLREGMALDAGGETLVALDRPGAAGAPGPLWRVELPVQGEAEEAFFERRGELPLPPYVRRAPGPADRERYQTVFARELGAVAAPTAGLHLSEALLGGLDARGVETARVTLHVGPGTFRPVEAEDPRAHRMHAERGALPEATARAVERARARRGRVVAVGTTVVRTLEARADAAGRLRPGAFETDLFLLPGATFRVVDALLTNFHLPRSTLLMLVCAFAGRERVLGLYREAVERRYRFYSYGDAMLLGRGWSD